LDQKFVRNTFSADCSADFGSQLLPWWVIVSCGFWNPQETFLRNILRKMRNKPWKYLRIFLKYQIPQEMSLTFEIRWKIL
jgi:hypothetical protein